MKGKRLLFVSANRYANPYPVYPLGISYLVTYLRQRLTHYEFRVYDFNLDAPDAFLQCLEEFRPDYIGLSLRNVDDVNFYSQESFISGYRSIVDLVRQHTRVPLIIGGSAFSIYPKELFSLFTPDFGIHGEGEESLYRLLVSLDQGQPDFSIDGLVYRDEEGVRVNGRQNFITTPDLGFDSGLIDFYWDKAGMVNVQTKRGCPYRCIYCTYPLIEGHNVRTLDPGKIVETLRRLYEEHRVDYVFFTDSVFNISNTFNVELARKMIASGLPMHWGAYFSPHNLSYENLKLFADAGLTHIEFGTESLSDTTLKNYGKHFTVDEVVRVSDDCNKAGIYFCHFMIIGGYGETEQTIDESFENSKRIANTVFFPFVGMRIYPGTELHRIAIGQGIVDASDRLLEPVYYISPGIDYDSLKERAAKTGRRWVFADEDVATAMNMLRKRKRKGSLWHHLKT
ncbi:MAG TPA: lipid biosynthesis B12-binding/radical SAM protein [Bacteroidales bacterium]|nr:lipid biosynthesis B12-binding/radical SAM protein [Bacteroidales bacterium]HPS63576.1 lipid biosynthesis B12-binding/radical SAM protein [Bacteroidales bacterium]